jgi:hypothetical protein
MKAADMDVLILVKHANMHYWKFNKGDNKMESINLREEVCHETDRSLDVGTQAH